MVQSHLIDGQKGLPEVPYAMDVDSIKVDKLTQEESKNASRKANAFDAENLDIIQETAPHSPVTPLTQISNHPRENLNQGK